MFSHKKRNLAWQGRFIGFGKRGLLEKGSFQKSPFSRDSREFRDSRDFSEPPDCGKQRRIPPFSRDSRESRDFRDSRDFSSEKTPFVMTPFSGPERRARFEWKQRVRTNSRGGCDDRLACKDPAPNPHPPPHPATGREKERERESNSEGGSSGARVLCTRCGAHAHWCHLAVFTQKHSLCDE